MRKVGGQVPSTLLRSGGGRPQRGGGPSCWAKEQRDLGARGLAGREVPAGESRGGGNERQWRKEALKHKARSRRLQKVGEAEEKERRERGEGAEAEVREARPAGGKGLR